MGPEKRRASKPTVPAADDHRGAAVVRTVAIDIEKLLARSGQNDAQIPRHDCLQHTLHPRIALQPYFETPKALFQRDTLAGHGSARLWQVLEFGIGHADQFGLPGGIDAGEIPVALLQER